MYGCLCDVLKMQYGTPNVNLRAISPGGYGSVLPEGACLQATPNVNTHKKHSPPSKLLLRETSRQDAETNETRSYQSQSHSVKCNRTKYSVPKWRA